MEVLKVPDSNLGCVKDLWWYNTTMHNKYKKYFTILNTDTVAYATHNGSYSTECKKEIHYTLVHNNCNIY